MVYLTFPAIPSLVHGAISETNLAKVSALTFPLRRESFKISFCLRDTSKCSPASKPASPWYWELGTEKDHNPCKCETTRQCRCSSARALRVYSHSPRTLPRRVTMFVFELLQLLTRVSTLGQSPRLIVPWCLGMRFLGPVRAARARHKHLGCARHRGCHIVWLFQPRQGFVVLWLRLRLVS
jgi:hypothetical protein